MMEHVKSEILVLFSAIAFLQSAAIRFVTGDVGVPYTSMTLSVLLVLFAIWVEIKKRNEEDE
ncbi:MAG: hypothetical protein IPM41_06450 [Sphingomonadales bacterium]|nr:hypothetical protein [Sphingomonadales bacterium]